LTVGRELEQGRDRTAIGIELAEQYGITLFEITDNENENSGWGPDGRERVLDQDNDIEDLQMSEEEEELLSVDSSETEDKHSFSVHGDSESYSTSTDDELSNSDDNDDKINNYINDVNGEDGIADEDIPMNKRDNFQINLQTEFNDENSATQIPLDEGLDHEESDNESPIDKVKKYPSNRVIVIDDSTEDGDTTESDENTVSEYEEDTYNDQDDLKDQDDEQLLCESNQPLFHDDYHTNGMLTSQSLAKDVMDVPKYVSNAKDLASILKDYENLRISKESNKVSEAMHEMNEDVVEDVEVHENSNSDNDDIDEIRACNPNDDEDDDLGYESSDDDADLEYFNNYIKEN
jgi:hypothetical protein